MAQIKVTADNTPQVLAELERKKRAALEACGNQAVSHAKQNITEAGRRDTGNMINNINHRMVKNDECHVGTNVDYAIYHEVGTGTFAADGKGRKGWWVYVKGEGSKKGKVTGKIYSKAEAARIMAGLRSQGLDAYMTNGIRPIHFLRNAIKDNIDEYKSIIEKHLK